MAAARRSQVRVPQRGDKRALLETVTRNAEEEFTRHRLRRAERPQHAEPGAHRAPGPPRAARGAAAHRVLRHGPPPGHRLRRLDGRAGGRPAQQARVPALQGQHRRRRRGEANDDFAAMEEVLTRRLTAYLDERDQPVTERGDKPGKFAYPPQLLLVDGGKGQLSAAKRVLDELGLDRRDPGRRPGQAVRGGVRPGPQRAGARSRGAARRSSCCSASATRPTASPSRSTASFGASG